MRARAWLDQQLHPSADDGLPPQVQAQIDAMDISQNNLIDSTTSSGARQQMQRARQKAAR